MVVLAASIITRGGKAILSRQFREINRSRVEALLASFPKLADAGTQHTTVEQDNVRFVYQPLDELYMVLITNKQSNILQDIDSLHLFAQVVTSICKKLDEREILRNAFELLSAFDELVTMGYRENLTMAQIKTFLEMESHEERIQEIIARNKELEASEERKRKAKQLEMQRKEAARSAAYGRGVAPKMPQYPTYTPPPQPTVTDSYDSYQAEKNKTFNKPLASRGKGMQLGKKGKNTDIFDKVKADLPEVEEPVVAAATTAAPSASTNRVSQDVVSGNPINVTITESISAKLGREGNLTSFEVKGDLQLKITDPALTKLNLSLLANEGPLKAQFKTHPNLDKNLFTSQKLIQLKDTSKKFPTNASTAVLRWRATAPAETPDVLPINFTVWTNKSTDDSYTVTVEYQLADAYADLPEPVLSEMTVTIPYQTSEPSVSSFDAQYSVTGDSLEWTIGAIDSSNNSGSFEFEAQADDDGEFFPMQVRFDMARPYIDVDVLSATLLDEDEAVTFDKVVRTRSDGIVIE
ncbi:coatomer subunit delta [Lithohypha guttulata]|uniref:Coatomer subunit delta n=1 Tax=Lithohypha guttulata TaxID=1690604 RepID=A0AAN7T7P9_9EURO|nr:coatomer subunit delta [Lithohypha guttulata]KAK5104166.1 coatomer subunit delta [Lithohypha guttulata]